VLKTTEELTGLANNLSLEEEAQNRKKMARISFFRFEWQAHGYVVARSIDD
jgi:hypothetical protein